MTIRGSAGGMGAGAFWRDLIIVSLLVLVSLYLFSHWRWRPASPDERHYMAWGLKISRDGAYENEAGRPVTIVPPMHPYLLALGFRLFGPSVDAAQAMSLVFGSLCIGLVFLLGRGVWNRRVGLIAALLLMTAAKGEFWRYANRVLNDIHLTFFMLLTCFGLCLWLRHGRLWMAALSGAALGLGLLTKEFMLILSPVLILVFLLGRGSAYRRLVHLAAAVLLAWIIVLPWGIHVSRVTGSPLGGVGQRAKGHATEVIRSEKAWGVRSSGELWKMVRFWGRPVPLAQAVYLGALLYAVWWTIRKRSGAGFVLVSSILAWFGFFALFKAPDLNLRRLIPLMPIFSVLSAVAFDDLWRRRAVLSEKMKLSKTWIGYGFSGLFVLFLAHNLDIQKAFRDFDPFTFASSSRPPYLLGAARRAMSCLPTDAAVLTNQRSLLYFYSGGRYRVKRLKRTVVRTIPKWIDEREAGARGAPAQAQSPVLYDFSRGKRRMYMDEASLLDQLRQSGCSHLVLFRSRNPASDPPGLETFLTRDPERFVPICQDADFSVYRIKLTGI